MSGEYDLLTPDLQALDPLTRFPLYSGTAFAENGTLVQQAGMGEYGKDRNFRAWNADFAANIKMAQAIIQMATNYLQSANGWAVESRSVARLSDTTFALAGVDATQFEALQLVYTARRAIMLIQASSDSGYVVGIAHDEANSRAIVTVASVVVDAGLTAVWFGQDPSNAPKSGGGGDAVLAAIYHTSDY